MTRSDKWDGLGKGPPQPDRQRQVDRALDKLREIVWQGLEHGFFECTVIGEIIHERKRRLLIKAGNSFQFVIAADELGLAGRS
jgi:hypothetical protein